MTQWNFYFSGILYGKFYEEAGTVLLEALDVETGCFLPRKPLEKTEDSFFQELCSRSMADFFRIKEELEGQIPNEPKRIKISSGREFSNRRGEAYIERNRKFPLDLLYEREEDGGCRIYGAAMAGRDTMALIVRKGMEDRTILKEWKLAYPCADREKLQPGPVYPVHFLGTFMVPTRDGERLAADVYLPKGAGERIPAVLVRTPYGKRTGAAAYFRFVQRGYAVVIQDVRGREDSTGEWQPMYWEVEDGDDTLNWIAAQEWSDGQAAMTGGSYLGYVQWAAAASGNPHLKAMLSQVCAGSAFHDMPRRGGCLTSGALAWAFSVSQQRRTPELMERKDWDDVLDIRPLAAIPEKALGYPVPFITKWLEHKDLDDFWRRSSWKDRYAGGPVPAFIMSGWFDDNGMGTTEALDLVKDWPKGSWKAVLGPWKHSGNADHDLHGHFMGEDALRYDIDLLALKWLDHFLKGAENGIERTPTVEYYTLGENRWKSAAQWPPESTEISRLYLDGTQENEAAGTKEACGKGRLSLEDPEQTGKDTYVYDPDHPSTHLIDMSENEMEIPEDYTEEEKRENVLSYTTPPAKRPWTITGDVRVHLYFSCDHPDTDFVVRITDVDEKGRSVKLADGVLDVKYRDGFEKPSYMEPGGIYKAVVRTTKISNTFLPGHSLRLTITSSAKNFIFPNSNTTGGYDSETREKAVISVHRGKENASFLEFPKEA